MQELCTEQYTRDENRLFFYQNSFNKSKNQKRFDRLSIPNFKQSIVVKRSYSWFEGDSSIEKELWLEPKAK